MYNNNFNKYNNLIKKKIYNNKIMMILRLMNKIKIQKVYNKIIMIIKKMQKKMNKIILIKNYKIDFIFQSIFILFYIKCALCINYNIY